ncbi:MAG: LysE family transporter [Burkholderiaceae bacterium]|jgi:L-lysine exporter family protein LysE/ArgO|nr:LysE family transporter [Burkholderiaceae bacterium]
MLSLSLAIPAGLTGAYGAGIALSLATIMALGPQNVHVMRMGLMRQHVGLTILTCALADVVLIATGVLGLAHLGGLSDKLQGAMVGAGALFLLVYGWQAAQRFIRPAKHTTALTGDTPNHSGQQVFTRKQAVLAALAFSFLNPHAWLDTAVIIGTASLAYGQTGGVVFGAGAATGSLIWFCGLGLAVYMLGRRIGNANIWHWLDGLVALMMWGTAAWLLGSLL